MSEKSYEQNRANRAINIVNQILGAVHEWLPVEQSASFAKFRQANNDRFDEFAEQIFIDHENEILVDAKIEPYQETTTGN